MKLTQVVNFIKHFWRNLCGFQHFAISFDSGYAARSINYVKKSFMKLTPGQPRG
jgi:hypothetical protein